MHDESSPEGFYRCRFCLKPEAYDGFHAHRHKAGTLKTERVFFLELTVRYTGFSTFDVESQKTEFNAQDSLPHKPA